MSDWSFGIDGAGHGTQSTRRGGGTTVRAIAFTTEELGIIEQALRRMAQELGAPPQGVPGLDRPATERDTVDHVLRKVIDS